jgi:DNA-binding MurR/RpiR family transcriptional regulator
MERNWAERLAAHRGGLTRREVDLIEFISSHPHEAAFLKQSDLAVRAGVSKPVVISCFRALGYPDYLEFLEGIQGFYAGQIDSAQASRVALKDVTDVAGLVSLALDVEAATLETLRRHLDAQAVGTLAQALLGAGTVWLYAEGTGFHPAHYLAQRLRRCGLRAFLVGGDRSHLVDDLGPLAPGDLFLTFFYTQDGAQVAALFDLVRSRGGVTALVTGSPDPDLFGRADHHLFVPRGQWNFKNSLAAPMAFAQILLLAVEFLGGPEVQDRLNVLETTRKGFVSRKSEEEGS